MVMLILNTNFHINGCFTGIPPHAHQLKNSELPQNEKKNFLLQINTKFLSGGTKKILPDSDGMGPLYKNPQFTLKLWVFDVQ